MLLEEGKSTDEAAALIEAGRVAEKQWKLLYASLGFAMTLIAFLEVEFSNMDAERVLRDMLVCWGAFVSAAS